MRTRTRTTCATHRRAGDGTSGLGRLARCLAWAIALAATQPHSARAGLNVWTSSGPLGAGVNTVAVDPATAGTIYAGTAGKGVFKSVDGGETWHAANMGLGDIYIELVTVHPILTNTVYATSPNHGVFRSTNGGESWSAINAGLPSPAAHLLAVDPISATLYASTSDGVSRSLDGGDSWAPTALRTIGDDGSGDGLSLTAWIDCLAIDPSTATIYACFFTWANQPGPAWQLLRSADGGATWNGMAMPTSGGPVAIAIDSTLPATIYIATYEPIDATSRVLKSMDDGAQWETVEGALPGCESGCRIDELTLDSAQPRTLYAATDRGVYAITEGGESWRSLNTGMADHTVMSIAIEPGDPTVAHAATSDGVFSIRQTPSCGGDCDGNGAVDIDELVTIVDITLGGTALEVCGAGDAASDGSMGVSDVVTAVASALRGCPGSADDPASAR